MVDPVLSDLERENLDRWQLRVKKFGVEKLLIPLSKGDVPDWLPVSRSSGRYFRDIVDKIDDAGKSSQQLTPQLKGFYNRLQKFRELMFSFNRPHYESLLGEEKGKYSIHTGQEFSYALQEVMKGHKVPQGYVFITDLPEYFVYLTKKTFGTDPKTGMQTPVYPYQLKRTD